MHIFSILGKTSNRLVICLIFGLLLVMPMRASAQILDVFPQCGQGGAASNSAVCRGGQGSLFGPGGVWNKILNIITYVAGSGAVLVILVASIGLVFSGGNSGAVATAKNTIIYASIGLVVAGSANIVVNFVIVNI